MHDSTVYRQVAVTKKCSRKVLLLLMRQQKRRVEEAIVGRLLRRLEGFES